MNSGVLSLLGKLCHLIPTPRQILLVLKCVLPHTVGTKSSHGSMRLDREQESKMVAIAASPILPHMQVPNLVSQLPDIEILCT